MISSMVEHPTGNQRVRGSIRGSASRWSLTNQESLTDELYTAKLYQMVGMPRNWNIGAISCFDFKKMVLLLFSILPRVNWLTLSDTFRSEKGFIKKAWFGGGGGQKSDHRTCLFQLIPLFDCSWTKLNSICLMSFLNWSLRRFWKKVVSLTNVIIPSQPSWVFEDPYTE